MRILHVMDSSGVYGAEAIVLGLTACQRDAGNLPVILSLGGQEGEVKAIELEGRRRGLEILKLPLRNGFSLEGGRKVIEMACAVGTDIIHSHGYKPDILLGFLPRRWRKVPVLSTLHGWTATSMFSKMGIYRLLNAVALKRLDRVISVSSVTAGNAVFRILGIRAAVVNNGIPHVSFEKDFLKRAFPEIAELCEKRFAIISVGRLSREKGSSILLEAVGRLVKEGEDVFLALVGEGPERARLENLAKVNGISERTVFLGYQHAAFRLLPYFDVFVLPSLTEGLPVTMLEAMQAGTPIVATRVGEVPQLLEDGALGQLARPGDVKSLAQAIGKVINHQGEAGEKASLCRIKAIETYSVESMCRAYKRHYNQVVLNWKKHS